MNARGMTLAESVVAIGILGLVLLGIMPALVTQADANGFSEDRAGAVAAGQEVLEVLRLADPVTLPVTGTDSPQDVIVNGRTYQVTTSYCLQSALCATNSRHLYVEVSLAGNRLYTLETVYARLR